MNKLPFTLLLAVVLIFTATAWGQGLQPAPSGPGEIPAGDRPPAKKHHLTYEDRQAWHRILKWPEECEAEYRRQKEAGFDDKGTWLQFWELEPHKYLVKIICFLAAYQANQRYYYYDETQSPPVSAPLTLKVYDQVGKKLVAREIAEVGGFSEFDDRKKELVINSKFRGLGDCGSRAVYRIKNGRAVLKEFRAKFDCDGKEWVPEKAPLIYKEK